MKEKIAIIGLGYVGLPVAIAFARKFPNTVGFDINCTRIDELKKGHDRNEETPSATLLDTALELSCDPNDLATTTMFVVAVPTPVDENNVPDLTPLVKASEFVGKHIKPGAIICYESTVYPGATEEVCGPILEKVSGLPRSAFKLAYSPERINPGDTVNTLETVVKVVSGEDADTLERVAAMYRGIVPAGVHLATSIKVAEAAKVIENTQRDLNIALMNELSMIFDRMSINTYEVLEAAGTKWNFLKFSPGLVGGHCIGVDPYYLTYKAKELGYDAKVILSGRTTNDNMGAYIARKTVQMMIKRGKDVARARVLVMGATFKENVEDIRNSKVADVIQELKNFSVNVDIVDPHANSAELHHEYGFRLTAPDQIRQDYDAVIVAVSHQPYLAHDEAYFQSITAEHAVLVDIKGLYRRQRFEHVQYWSL